MKATPTLAAHILPRNLSELKPFGVTRPPGFVLLPLAPTPCQDHLGGLPDFLWLGEAGVPWQGGQVLKGPRGERAAQEYSSWDGYAGWPCRTLYL